MMSPIRWVLLAVVMATVATSVSAATRESIKYFLVKASKPPSFTVESRLSPSNVAGIRNSKYSSTQTLYVMINEYNYLCASPGALYRWGIFKSFLRLVGVLAAKVSNNGESGRVLLVDWRDVYTSNFLIALNQFPRVGEKIAEFLMIMQKEKQLKLENVHIIGLGIGAHIAGIVGRKLPGIGRITGLDPVVRGESAAFSLKKEDARFVDVIYTDRYPSKYTTAHAELIYKNARPNPKYCAMGTVNPAVGCPNGACKHELSSLMFAFCLRFPGANKCNLAACDKSATVGKFSLGLTINPEASGKYCYPSP